MNLQNQTILSNLRMLRSLKHDQWLCTKRGDDGKLEIDDICDNTYYNNVILTVKLDGWESSKECLKSLYCDDIPSLVNHLIANDEYKDLKNLNKLLKGSLEGLDALNNTYNVGAITNHLNSLKFDYGETISEKISCHLKSVDYSEDSP